MASRGSVRLVESVGRQGMHRLANTEVVALTWPTSAGPRKRRTREHVIADLSVNHIERFVLRCGWTVQRTTHDYGVDLLMETYNSAGEPETGRVSFQLKATDKLQVRKLGQAVAVRLDWRDLAAW